MLAQMVKMQFFAYPIYIFTEEIEFAIVEREWLERTLNICK